MFKINQAFTCVNKVGMAAWSRTKSVMRSNAVKRACMFVVVFLCATGVALADAAGVTGINDATATFRSYLGPIKNLLYILAAIVSMIGAFSIYFKMQNGDQDVKKTIMMTVGGCVALVAMATALPSFFGESIGS